jgi:hypothetical protein
MTPRDAYRSPAGRRGIVCLLASLTLGACETILDVEFPGTIPGEQLNDPSLAPVLVRSVISDLECGYSGFAGASAAHSDEYETSNQNVPLANWGERSITADEGAYVVGACEASFGVQLILHTARFQSETVYNQLNGWSDTQVPNRASLMAQVRAYGAYSLVFMGETFCQVAFDGGAAQPAAPATPWVPLAAALTLAEQKFTEAITLATQANNQDILNMARVGRARARAGLAQAGVAAATNWAGAAADAALVPDGYVKNADRGSENFRRFNDIAYTMNQLGAYTIAFQLRTITDPRLLVVNSGRGAFIPSVPLWITNRYTGNASPIPLATYREAQLIRAEALIELNPNDPSAGMAILNARRQGLGLGNLTATTKDEAIAHVINERRMELAFQGGHRLYDLLRKRLPWKGANGSTQNANPVTGRPYGTTTCWPHPTREIAGA